MFVLSLCDNSLWGLGADKFVFSAAVVNVANKDSGWPKKILFLVEVNLPAVAFVRF